MAHSNFIEFLCAYSLDFPRKFLVKVELLPPVANKSCNLRILFSRGICHTCGKYSDANELFLLPVIQYSFVLLVGRGDEMKCKNSRFMPILQGKGGTKQD